ncbi:MAG: DUF4097 family beta strand repeat-containing protein [Anaerostipes sp.]|nr:DUF4097 family beta strand repeat-containing protein [Anaerostipes sp.]
MKKFYKVCGIIGTIFFVIGGGCVIASVAMGVSFTDIYNKILNKASNYTSYGSGNVGKKYTFETKDLDNMTIVVRSGDVTIEESSDSQIHLINYGDENTFEGNVTNRTLNIKQVSKGSVFHKIRHNSAVLQLPKEHGFKDILVTLGSGQIDASWLNTGLFTADVGSGDMEVAQIKADEIDIKSGSGDVGLTVLGKEEDYNCSVIRGSGDVHLGGQDIEKGHHSSYHHKSSKSIDVKSGSGDVEIEFQ